MTKSSTITGSPGYIVPNFDLFERVYCVIVLIHLLATVQFRLQAMAPFGQVIGIDRLPDVGPC